MCPLKGIRITLIAALIVACGAAVGLAQEFRGSITGRVVDNNGAAVANAAVTITNTATNTSSSTTTNGDGDYTALYLTPGSYSITVEATGFKKSTRQNVEIRVGDKLQIDLRLEVGNVSETVNVTAEAPILETNTASAGQVIDQRRISELPLSDGNPFVLSRLASGISYVGDLKFSRPFDNAGTSGIVADGAPGRNEFTLDGIPNMASGGGLGRVAFVPPADAVQEFKVETASFDAQSSHTAGATVNVTLKSGTNSLHGTVYEFVRNDVLSANDFFLNRTNLTATPSRDGDRDGKADRDPLRYNRYGFTIGGPVFLPRFGLGGKSYIDGRNKSFFFFAYEGLKDVFPEPGQFTVPTLKMREGNFSELLPGIVIYDPATARQVTGGVCGNDSQGKPRTCVVRDPFPGNIIPANQISSIAKTYLSYYPLPNQPGNAQGQNNYISGNPRTDNFHSESYRFDQVIGEKQRFFVRYSHNNRVESRGNWTGEVNGIRPTGNFLFRINDGGAFDHVYNFSPTVILNSRAGFSRFNEPNIRQHEGQINPASLGFPAATAALFGSELYLPRFDFPDNSYSELGDTVGGGSTFNIYSFQSTLTKIAGAHSFRMGYDFRSYRENAFGAGHSAGRYDFNNNFTRGPLDNSTGSVIGQPLAAFLLGQPNGGTIERNAARSNQTLYNGVFFHDDWKATSNLTLNLGLRYELEGATTERYNRNLRGFDSTASSPIEAAAKAAYAAKPIPEIPVSGFQVKGGLLFANDDNRGFWENDRNNFQPRVGFAFRLNDKTVLRGGWGVFTVPFVMGFATGFLNQSGFSQSTPLVGSANNGLSFVGTLANPFPSGVLSPPGASLGLSTFLGQGINFLPVGDPINNPQAQRWSFGVQRELPGNWLVDLAYVGNAGYDGVVNTNIFNTIPRQYLSTSLFRDQSMINTNSFLIQTVDSPFRNLVPGAGINNPTVQRQQLLRPFPHFGTITGIRNDASSRFHSGQLRVEKRFSRGYSLLAAYNWSKFLEEGAFLNESDTEFERRFSDADVPHRLVVSGIWELPFGRGRKFGANWHPALNVIAGGWQAQGIWNWQSGRTNISIGNVYYNGDITKLKTEINGKNADSLPGVTVFDVSGFYFTDAAVRVNPNDPNSPIDPSKQRNDSRIQLVNNIRVQPSRWAGFRGQGLNLWDLSVSKNFAFTERFKLQLRGEFINAFNTPVFNNPNLDPRNENFGKVTSQANLPRNVQIGLKLIF